MAISTGAPRTPRPGHLDFPGTPPPRGARTMESSTPNRTAPSRPGRFHRGRALAITAADCGSERSAPPSRRSAGPAAVRASRLVCADSPARQNSPAVAAGRAQARRGQPHRGTGPGWLEPRAPPGRPAARTATPDRGTPPLANPILLIGIRFDPTTPLANAKLAERRLGNAVLLTHDGYGHMSQVDPSTCVMQALGRYFTGLTTPARGTICPSDHGPFDPGFGQPAASR